MAGISETAEQLIDAALKLIAEGGWKNLTLPQIAAEAGVSLPDAYSAFPTKTSLLNGLLARTDRQMLTGDMPDPAENVRDRLFEVVMRRLDALQPHKDAVAAIVEDLPRDPMTALAVTPGFATSIAWTLEAAGVSASGLRGSLRIQGLAIIYLTVLRTWLQDDTADAARTMATLDRALRRADMLIRACPGMASGQGPRQGSASSSGTPASGPIPGDAQGEPPPGDGLEVGDRS